MTIVMPINTNKNGNNARIIYKPINKTNPEVKQPSKFSRRNLLISSLKSCSSSALL